MSSSSDDSEDSEEDALELVQYKIVLLGDQGVGKTCLALRLAQDNFAAVYKPTQGLDFYVRQIALPTQVSASLKIWDLGSSIGTMGMAANYIHGCHAVLLVYDITQQQSFTLALEWLQLLRQMYEGVGLPYIGLVAHKADLEAGRAVTPEQHNAASMEHDIYSYSMSAKTGEGVLAAFFQVAADLAGIPVSAADIAAACRGDTIATCNHSGAGAAGMAALVMSPGAVAATSRSTSPKLANGAGRLSGKGVATPSSPSSSSAARRHAATRSSKQPGTQPGTAGADGEHQEEDADDDCDKVSRPYTLQHCRCCCTLPVCRIM